MGSAWDRIVALAEEQWGLITRQQAQARGAAWTTLSRMARTGRVERVAHGVYRLRGAPPVAQLALRAAWLQLAPALAVWERTAAQGVVSHRSAAALYGLGELPADVHEFSLPTRRQTRRADVRLHRRRVEADAVIGLGGLAVTRPARIAADLLADGADAEAVARIVAQALADDYDQPAALARALAPLAHRFGLDRDGSAMLGWLLDLSDVSPGERGRWLEEASAQDAVRR